MRTKNRVPHLVIAEIALLALLATVSLAVPVHENQQTPSFGTASVHRTFWLTGQLLPSPAWNGSLPGPSIVVDSGDLVTIMLNSGDNILHKWFIDFNNDTSLQSTEVFMSPYFGSPSYVNYTFTPVIGVNVTASGTYEYRCYFHPMMAGKVTIKPSVDYDLSNDGPVSVQASTSSQVTITATLVAGTAQPITLSCLPTSLPPGVTCGTFTFDRLTPSASGTTSILTFSVASSVTAGPYSFQITGSSQGSNQTTTTISLDVTAVSNPDFHITLSPISSTVVAGAQSNSTVTVTPQNGFYGTVSLTSSLMPSSGLTCTFGATMLSAFPGSTNLSCLGSYGEYTVNVTGTSGALSHSATLNIRVQDFDIAVSSYSISTQVGTAATVAVTIVPHDGFSSTVNYAIKTDDSRLTCALTLTSLTSGAGSSTLTCSGPQGDYAVNITATSGALSHTLSISVKIVASSQSQPTGTSASILGLAPQIFYEIVGGTSLVIIASAFFLLRQARNRKPAS